MVGQKLSWSFLEASTKTEAKLVYWMIDNVYIDLTPEKKGSIRDGNYTHLSHIKKTFIYANQYP